MYICKYKKLFSSTVLNKLYRDWGLKCLRDNFEALILKMFSDFSLCRLVLELFHHFLDCLTNILYKH